MPTQRRAALPSSPQEFIVQVEVINDQVVNYVTATQAAKKHALSRAWVKRLAQQGRLPGAFKVGQTWCVPAEWIPQKLKRGRRKTTDAQGTGEEKNARTGRYDANSATQGNNNPV